MSDRWVAEWVANLHVLPIRMPVGPVRHNSSSGARQINLHHVDAMCKRRTGVNANINIFIITSKRRWCDSAAAGSIGHHLVTTTTVPQTANALILSVTKTQTTNARAMRGSIIVLHILPRRYVFGISAMLWVKKWSTIGLTQKQKRSQVEAYDVFTCRAD